jgi:hypothetical protein
MEIVVKFKAIDFRGKNVSKNITMECPDFKEEVSSFQIGQKKVDFKLTIDSQIQSWLDSLPKEDLMIENDWYIILNFYKVKEKTNKSKTIEELCNIAFVGTEEEILEQRTNFLIIWNNLKDEIKNLSEEKQFLIVLKSMGMSLTAQSVAYKHATELMSNISGRVNVNKLLN